MNYSVVVALANGRTSRHDGFKDEAAATAFAEMEGRRCPNVSVKVVKEAEPAEGDVNQWRTSPDENDGHVHKVEDVNEAGMGKTAPAGNPPHVHKIERHRVVDGKAGGYVSIHAGPLVKDDDADPEPLEMTDDERTAVMDFVSTALTKTGSFKGGFEG